MRDADLERATFRRGSRRRVTEAERKLWLRLRDRRPAGCKFVRQESIGPYIADFACRETKLIVELDGSQHADSERDRVRDAWIVGRGYRVTRFWNHDVLNGIEAVLETILSAQSENATQMVCVPLSPPGGEREISHAIEAQPDGLLAAENACTS